MSPIGQLHLGEAHAIALALEINADFVLIDERRGTRKARELGLQTLGLLGVPELAADEKLLDFEEAILKLRGTSFRMSEDLKKAVDRKIAQRRKHQEP